MRYILPLALLLAPLAFSADADFNGRWDITVDQSKNAWWLKVENAGTRDVAGDFVGFPGGQVDHIPDIAIKNGELTFKFRGKYRGYKDTDPLYTGVYRARMEGGKLNGSFYVDDKPDDVKQWTGVRAPVITAANVDPAAYKQGAPVDLFNGHDVSNWNLLQPAKTAKWNVVDGVTRNEPDASDLVSKDKFWNFKMHAEFRLGQGSNSGIGLRGRYEVQIYGDYGQPASTHGNGALYSRIIPTLNASRPPNEWQEFDITLIGNVVTVALNGMTIINQRPIEGLTAIAVDANEAEPGPIVVQGDHGVVEFRKMTVTPLLSSHVAMGHYHLNVSNMAAQKQFWTEVMGGTPVMLSNIEGVKFPDALVFLKAAPSTGGSMESVIQHIGFRVKDLKSYTERLTAANVKFDANANGRQVMVTGPDGIRIELTRDDTLIVPIANHHIHFYTGSVEDTRSWYVKTFGAVPGKRGQFQAADLTGVNLSFSEAQTPVLPTAGRSLDHIGFEIRDLEAFCKELTERGVKFDQPYRRVPSLGIALAFLTDPWGTRIELTEGLNKL
jgi:catechol 2,3-dioxygenase-like lactoylglutathione lyase family enzyme